MKRTTLEYYKLAIKQAGNAMESIQRANADYDHECELTKNAFESDLLGEKGYKDRLKQLAQERDAKIEGFLCLIDKVGEEYAAEMAELGRLDGGRIDDGVMKLLNSGLQLTNEDWQELANAHKDNHVMTRILKERYNANRSKSEGDSLALRQKNNGLTFVQFGQSPQDRAENFSRFTKLLHYNAVSDSMPGEGSMAYASKGDYWNHCAKDSISHMMPFGDENFDTVDQDFPVEYVQAKPTIW